MKIISIMALIGCLLLTFPLAAQEEIPSCTPDLTPVRELLDQVDVLVSEDTTEDAIMLMNTASEQLQILIDACTPHPVVNLAERLVAHNGQLTLNYPENWEYEIFDSPPDAPNETIMHFTNTIALFESDTPVPVLNPGEQKISVYVGAPDGIFVGLDFTPSVTGLLTSYKQVAVQSLDDPGIYLGAIEQINIHDYSAAMWEFGSATHAAQAYAVELESETVYVLIVAMSAPGEMENLEPVVLEMATSLRYDPTAIVP
ncbi:MAG: hypothetical protein K8L97_26405 [Anaerolineae bacterium]|nr:hypothetical protein [Anaerolineae bacterium]